MVIVLTVFQRPIVLAEGHIFSSRVLSGVNGTLFVSICITGSLFHAHLKCWEAMIVLDLNGPKEAFEVLQEAAHSLEKLQDKTVTNFKQTQGLYFYSEGEIFCRARDYKRALQRLQLCLHYIEELPDVNVQFAKCYNAMGNCYYHGLEDYNKALELYSKALKMTEEISGSSESVSYTHLTLPTKLEV